jgi:hypothetical protein
MYCSSCGIEVAKELNYCNRCGANLSPATPVPQVYAPKVRMTGPTIALGLTIVLSFAAVFSSATKLFDRGLPPAAVAWIIIIGLAAVFGITSLIIRFWMTLLANRGPQMEEQRPAHLKRPQPNAQIPAAQTGPMTPPISSVTDHTTRTFKPVYREKRK